jgi:Amt family ammonium transporter
MLNTLIMGFVSFAFVGVAWAVAGYSLSFGPGNAMIGDLSRLALSGGDWLAPFGDYKIPALLYMAYQGTFAIITAALISGAIVERMRFRAYVLFITLWSLLVYCPVAHWVWSASGWLLKRGALDFAGGTVVHVNAGVAALVAALVLGARKDFGRLGLIPHNVPFVLLGSALLWFGWFGFNAGSAIAADGVACLAFANTMLAPCATLLVWIFLDYARTTRVTAVGVATGIVIGLVAITPAAGYVSPMSALLLGGLAAFPSYFMIVWRSRTHIDDSLDVFSAHGVGGITGALLTGVFADKAWNPSGADGLLHGNPAQLGVQALGVVVTLAYSGILTWVILHGIHLFCPLRATPKEESIGLDIVQHGEEAYSRGEGAILILERPARAGGAR